MGCAQSKTEDVAATAPAETETSAAPAETEPVTVEQPKVEETAAEESAPAQESVEPEAEVASSVQPANDVYEITGHEIDDNGVVLYIIALVEGDESFKRRFSEFGKLVKELGSPKSLPALPPSGLGAKLRGKHNPDLIGEREIQLSIVLNAIANDTELAETDVFKKFVQ